MEKEDQVSKPEFKTKMTRVGKNKTEWEDEGGGWEPEVGMVKKISLRHPLEKSEPRAGIKMTMQRKIAAASLACENNIYCIRQSSLSPSLFIFQDERIFCNLCQVSDYVFHY